MSREIKSLGEHMAQWVTISSDEYESMKSTLEIISEPELLEQIRMSRKISRLEDTKNFVNLLKNRNSTY
jgi:PHD/YefM family antitoxin component YafN of YafNO toxin-antitoxin module